MPEAADPTDAAQIDHWLDQGLYLQVHPHVDRLATSALPAERQQAVRALRYLGADRCGDALLLRTGRQNPHDADSVAALWRGVASRSGPFVARRCITRWPLPANATPAQRAEAESTRMRLAGGVRDFEAMHRHRATVLALDAQSPWLWVEWAYSCLDEDRAGAAQEACDEALRLHPGYRAALSLQAHLHELAGRRDAAKALLSQALAERECAAFGTALWPLLLDDGEFDAAAAVLDRVQALWPRIEPAGRAWLAARRADTASRNRRRAGALAEAATHARAVPGTGFYSRLAERIATLPEGAPAAPRTVLPVPFVHQHWMTCGPATLTALAGFFGRAVDHLEVAEAICYDGTTHASERQWAVDEGWQVQEFTADWSTTQSLIEAGWPFALTTTEVSSGHLQAVIGVDALRQTLIVRDPTQAQPVEFDAQVFFERYRSQGPRAMLMRPVGAPPLPAGLLLPDEAAWDGHFAVQAALQRHARDEALAAAQALQAQHAGHRLAWQARRAMAIYDGDEPAILAATEALLALHPGDEHLVLSKAASLWAMGGRDAQLAWLREHASKPGADVALLVRLADRLLDDERRFTEAASLLRRALRRSPSLAPAWAAWGDLLWRQGEALRGEALVHLRSSSSLRDTDEGAADVYARALRLAGDADGALAWLTRRVQRLGSRSGAPVQTLFNEFEAQDRTEEGFAALQAARAQRPDDVALGVFSAEALLRHGRLDEARALLDALPAGGVSAASRLRARARLAEADGDFAAAQAHVEAALALTPLDIELHRLATRQVDRLHGRDAAVAYLDTQAGRHSHFVALQRLLYDWLPRGHPRELAQLEHLVAIQDRDPWCLRERALVLSMAGQHDAAEACAREALALAPGHCANHAVLGSVLLERDGYDAARPHLQDSLRLDVEQDWVVRKLVQAAPDAARARSALDQVATELERQPSVGDAVLTFQAWAADHWEPALLLSRLEALRQAWPMRWQPILAIARTLAAGSGEQAAQAEQLLAETRPRFATVALLALDHALVLRQLNRRDEARQAVQQALRLAPAWNRAVRLWVDLIHETDCDWPLACHALQRATALAPQDADLLGLLAWVHEQAGEPALALRRVRASLALDAEPEWVWKVAQRCADALVDGSDFSRLLADIEHLRPADPWPRIVRARLSSDPADALAAAEAALERQPRATAAWHERFTRLLELGRHDEAERLADALPWPDGGPPELRAWAAKARRARGDKPAAQAAMSALLAQAPHEHTLWKLLADWHDEDEAHADYVAASQQMLRLAPRDAVSRVYLGHALAKAGRHAEAVPMLQDALAMAPGHRFAALHLADSASQLGQHGVALEALETLWPHDRSEAAAERAVQLLHDASVAGLKGSAEPLDSVLERWLTRRITADRHANTELRTQLSAWRQLGKGALLDRLEETALADGGAALGAGIDWIEARAAGKRRAAALDAVETLLNHSQGDALPRALLRWLVQGRDAGNLATVLATWRERFRANDEIWGESAWALLQFERTAAAATWMADWRERGETPLWTLTNLCLLHATLGQWPALAEVAEAAARRDRDDTDTGLWHAVARAQAGDRAHVHEHVKRLQDQALEPWQQGLRSLLQAWLLWVWEGDLAGARRALWPARRQAGENSALRQVWGWLFEQLWREQVPGVLWPLLKAVVRRWAGAINQA